MARSSGRIAMRRQSLDNTMSRRISRSFSGARFAGLESAATAGAIVGLQFKQAKLDEVRDENRKVALRGGSVDSESGGDCGNDRAFALAAGQQLKNSGGYGIEGEQLARARVEQDAAVSGRSSVAHPIGDSIRGHFTRHETCLEQAE